MRRSLLAAVVVALFAAMLPGVAAAQAEPVESEGYLELSDGTSLRWTMLLPPGDGPFPMVLQYSGYNPGNNVRDGTFGKMVDQVVAEGIGVIGVNLRGTGCSSGTFVPFGEVWATDGVEVIDWIAQQPFSDGNVAMAGVSYPAIMSLATAVQQPEHLKAIMATVPLTDLYRDVAYPGGAFNQTFAYVWTLIQKYGSFFGLQEVAEGDAQCAANIATQNDPTDLTGLQAKQNPYEDSMERYTAFLQPENLASIEVPALVFSAWQDEQLGARATYGYEHLDPSRRWIVGANSDHIGFAGSEWYREFGTRFLKHFLTGGTPEDFDAPMVQIAHEVRKDATFDELSTYDTFPVPTVTTTLQAQPDGSFGLAVPSDAAELTYDYPQPAPSVYVGIDFNIGFNPSAYDETYKAPIPPGGSVAFTTPALAEPVEIMGPGSVDVWFSSTSTDVDIQATLVEVRPDGNELYVNRGWLRTSHRELDPVKSTPTRPWQTHLEADAQPLVAGEVTPLRVELWPTSHTFRAGSSMRLYLEAPVGFTGFRQLEFLPTPAVNTVYVGPDTPTRFVFGRTASPTVSSPLPECGTLLNQPCRTSPAPPPDGTLSLAPANQEAPAESESEPGPPPLPATGGGLAVIGAALAFLAARRRR